jgi:type IV secretory pathway VirB10-like protein
MSGSDSPDKSPNGFGSTVTGMSRYTRFPLMIAGGIVFLVILTIGYTYHLRTADAATSSHKNSTDLAEPGSPAPILDKAPVAGAIDATLPAPPNPEPAPQETAVNNIPPPPDPYQEAQARLWEQQQQEADRVLQARHSNWQNALGAATTVYTGQTPSNNRDKTDEGDSPRLVGSISRQAESLQANAYLSSTRLPALSPFELKAGAVIPSVLIGGINSDLPGQLIAQVSQNVCDTASGRHVLIPQGAKLVGIYASNVVMGQHRVLVAWNRVIYPDGSSLDLGAMSGADQGGYAGFADQANTHSWPTVRNALLLSAMTAGVQLSQAQPRSGDSAYSSQQIVAGALGMQMNQLGIGSVQRGLNTAPTLSIRPGYRFNVMVSKDILLTPWGLGTMTP